MHSSSYLEFCSLLLLPSPRVAPGSSLREVLVEKGIAAEMDADRFPKGLRVLAVDEDRVNLIVLKRALKVCNYNNVTTVTSDASTALDILRERKDGDDQFDLVIGEFFMPNGTNGLKLLERIALEMDIPVIVLSANDEMETMVKAIKHGACDYMVKPVCPEKVKNIWMHVVRKGNSNPRNKGSNGNDNPGEMVQSVDDENCEQDDAKHTRKHWKKNIKNGDAAKKQRVEWSSQLHSKFVEAINHIGLDNVVPKKILEVMNVDGLSRENVASHLQKYRMYLKKWKEGTLKYSAFMDEQQWLNGKAHINNMSIPECSSTNISNEHPPLGTSMSFPSSCSGISYASKLCASILGSNKGIPFDPDSFFEERAGGEKSTCHVPLQSPELANQPLVQIQSLSTDQVAPSSHLSLQSPELVNQPSIQIRLSSIGMFNQVANGPPQFTIFRNSSNSWTTDFSSSFHEIGQNARMTIGRSQRNISMNQFSRLVSSSHSASTSRNEYQNQMAGVMGTETPMVSFNAQATLAPLNFGSTGSSTVMPINNLAPGGTIGHQTIGDQENNNNQLPMATRAVQIGNYVMPTQMLNDGVASVSLPKGSNIDLRPVGDQVNSNNELPTGTDEAQNGAIDIDAFVAEWVQQDLLNNNDAFFDGNMEFAP